MATIISSGMVISDAVVMSGGTADKLYVFNKGKAVAPIISSGGFAYVSSGGALLDADVSAGGVVYCYNGAYISAPVTRTNSGGVYRGSLQLREGSYIINPTVSGEIIGSSGSVVQSGTCYNAMLIRGGTVNGTTISGGAITLGYLQSGGLGEHINVHKGDLKVSDGGVATDVYVSNAVVGTSSAHCYVYSGSVVNNISGTGSSFLVVSSGGLVTNTSGNGSIVIYADGVLDHLYWDNGGVYLRGGTVSNITLNSDGTGSGAWITVGTDIAGESFPSAYAYNITIIGGLLTVTEGVVEHVIAHSSTEAMTNRHVVLKNDGHLKDLSMLGSQTYIEVSGGVAEDIVMSNYTSAILRGGTTRNINMYDKTSTYVSTGAVLEGATLHSTTDNSASVLPTMYVYDGGVASDVVISGSAGYGGKLFISGGTTYNTTHLNYMTYVSNGGILVNPTISNQGQIALYSGTLIDPALHNGIVSCHSQGTISGGYTDSGTYMIFGSASGLTTTHDDNTNTGVVRFYNGGPNSNSTIPVTVVGMGSDIRTSRGGAVYLHGGTINQLTMSAVPNYSNTATVHVSSAISTLPNTSSGYVTDAYIDGTQDAPNAMTVWGGGHVSGAELVNWGRMIVSNGGYAENINIHDHDVANTALTIYSNSIASNVRCSGYRQGGTSQAVYLTGGTLNDMHIIGGGNKRYSVICLGGTVTGLHCSADTNYSSATEQMAYFYAYNGTKITDVHTTGYCYLNFTGTNTSMSNVSLEDDGVTSRTRIYVSGVDLRNVSGWVYVQLNPMATGEGAYCSGLRVTYPSTTSQSRLNGGVVVSSNCTLEDAVIEDFVGNTYLTAHSGAVVKNTTLIGNHTSTSPRSGCVISHFIIDSGAHCDGNGTGGAMFYDVEVGHDASFFPRGLDSTFGLTQHSGTCNLRNSCHTTNFVQYNGTCLVQTGAQLYSATMSGGQMVVQSNGEVHDLTILSGASLTISSTGAAYDVTSHAGAHVTVATGGTITYK